MNVFITFNIQVNRCITDILKLCKEFCLEMSKEDISDESLKAMNERLDLSVSMLMSFITLLGGKAEGLRLLLLRLDYNRFFSLRSSWRRKQDVPVKSIIARHRKMFYIVYTVELPRLLVILARYETTVSSL